MPAAVMVNERRIPIFYIKYNLCKYLPNMNRKSYKLNVLGCKIMYINR